MPEEERNFADIAEPPRSVPLSLKLFSVFGNQTVGGLFVLNFMLVFIWAGFSGNAGRGMDGDFIWKAITFIFVAVGTFVFVSGIISGLRRIRLYTNGRIALAELKSKTIREERTSKGGKITIKCFTFEYKAGGQAYALYKEFKNESTKLIEDEANEPVIYLDEKRDKGELLDSMHARIGVDDLGSFRLHMPALGYIYFLLDTVMISVFILGLLQIFGYMDILQFLGII
jgi:hypothetical protein